MNKPLNGIRNGRSIYSGLLIGLITLSCTNACIVSEAKADTITQRPINPIDPYEDINRSIFDFNDTVDDYIGEPLSDAYVWAVPQFVRTGVSNFFNNLKNVNVIFNDMLQAKFDQSLQDSSRLAINTTAGIGGLFDVAEYVDLPQHDEDFEQTLAVWGVSSGPYLVLPLLGPTTARGIPGMMFDAAANPSTYISVVSDITAPIQTLNLLNARANAEGALQFMKEAALDPYAFTREAVLQWRKNLANDGKITDDPWIDEEDEQSSNKQTTLASNSSKNFADAAQLFGNATQSFTEAAQAFQAVDEKLDKVKLPKNPSSKKEKATSTTKNSTAHKTKTAH